MIVRVVNVYVKEDSFDVFKAATLENRLGAMAEAGVARFDLLQDEADSSHFVLYEVYRDEQAALYHKETSHYRTWREAVAPMMAKPRQGIACSAVSPSEWDEWS